MRKLTNPRKIPWLLLPYRFIACASPDDVMSPDSAGVPNEYWFRVDDQVWLRCQRLSAFPVGTQPLYASYVGDWAITVTTAPSASQQSKLRTISDARALMAVL